MDITMYNCGFGDCFLLDNEDSHLLVDFGILPQSQNIVKKTQLNSVYLDLHHSLFFNNAACLLTHYHLDHYNGFEYICNLTNSNLKFRDIYIPDIWDYNSCKELISLLLITKIRKDLPLMKLVLTLLKVSGKLHCISANNNIENKYVALWPQKTIIGQDGTRLLSVIMDAQHSESGQFDEMLSQLFVFSSRLCEIVNNISDSGKIEEITRILNLNNDFTDFFNKYKYKVIIDKINKKFRNQLKWLGNIISIVFHNKVQCDNNILFTGDFNPQYLKYMPDMYSRYRVIKAPHHGTPDYYSNDILDLLSDKSAYLLIPYGANRFNWLPAVEYYNYCFQTKPTTKILRSNDFVDIKNKFSI